MTERNSAGVGFGPHVRALREASGLKQRQVADRIGMSQSQYSGIEAKTNRGYVPAPEVVAGLAKVFGVSEASLLQSAGYLTDDESSAASAAPAVAVPPGLIPRVVERLIELDELLNEGRAEVRSMADAMEDASARVEPLPPTSTRRRATG